VTVPLARPPALPRAIVPRLSAPSPTGNLGKLFPKVTPAPVVPGAGRARPWPVDAGGGTGTALTAETGAIGHAPSGVLPLLVTIAAGLAAVVVWLTMAGPARRVMLSLTHRRRHH
jgi:hypothetical protein